MSKCENCGTSSATSWTTYDKKHVCMDCYMSLKKQKLLDKSENINQASDFEQWKSSDLSEIFWIMLGEYQKRPNKKALKLMFRAYLWAVHADHGLSNSFAHALDWCGIDLYAEKNKDLPEE